MKYELPRSLKTQSFNCKKIQFYTKYAFCQNCPHAKDPKECWAKHLLDDLQMDCDINNEQKAENFVNCPKCKSDNVVGCAFDSYLCASCGHVFGLTKEQQRKVLGEHFEEIDKEEYYTKVDKIK